MDQGNSEEAAFRKAMSSPAEVWYPCGCKASAGSPKHCPEHHCAVCGKNTIEYTQGIKHADGSDLCKERQMTQTTIKLSDLQQQCEDTFQSLCEKARIGCAATLDELADVAGLLATVAAVLNAQRPTVNPKFVQIAAIPSDGGTHASGIFALDEVGCVWNYEGQYGWIPFTTERNESIESARERKALETNKSKS